MQLGKDNLTNTPNSQKIDSASQRNRTVLNKLQSFWVGISWWTVNRAIPFPWLLEFLWYLVYKGSSPEPLVLKKTKLKLHLGSWPGPGKRISKMVLQGEKSKQIAQSTNNQTKKVTSVFFAICPVRCCVQWMTSGPSSLADIMCLDKSNPPPRSPVAELKTTRVWLFEPRFSAWRLNGLLWTQRS